MNYVIELLTLLWENKSDGDGNQCEISCRTENSVFRLVPDQSPAKLAIEERDIQQLLYTGDLIATAVTNSVADERIPELVEGAAGFLNELSDAYHALCEENNVMASYILQAYKSGEHESVKHYQETGTIGQILVTISGGNPKMTDRSIDSTDSTPNPEFMDVLRYEEGHNEYLDNTSYAKSWNLNNQLQKLIELLMADNTPSKALREMAGGLDEEIREAIARSGATKISGMDVHSSDDDDDNVDSDVDPDAGSDDEESRQQEFRTGYRSAHLTKNPEWTKNPSLMKVRADPHRQYRGGSRVTRRRRTTQKPKNNNTSHKCRAAHSGDKGHTCRSNPARRRVQSASRRGRIPLRNRSLRPARKPAYSEHPAP